MNMKPFPLETVFFILSLVPFQFEIQRVFVLLQLQTDLLIHYKQLIHD